MLSLFKKYLRPFTLLALASCGLTFCQVLMELQLPAIMANIVDIGITHADLTYVIVNGCYMMAWAIGSVICVVIAALCASRVAMGFGRDVRQVLFSTIEACSLLEFEEFGTATLITRNTNDVQQTERFLQMILTMAVMTPAMLIGACIMAFQANAQMAGIVLIALPFIVVVVALFLKFGMPLLRSLQSRIDGVNRVMREGLQGVRVVRAYNREEYERKRFAAVNRDLSETYVKVGRLVGGIMPLMMLILNGTIVLLYWFGAVQVDAGTLSAGEIMALVQYVTLILISLMMASIIFALLPRTIAATERIVEVLKVGGVDGFASAAKNKRGARSRIGSDNASTQQCIKGESGELAPLANIDALEGIEHPTLQSMMHQGPIPTIALERVGFCFGGASKDCVSNITFSCEPETTTVILGPTGSGKTVLFMLMLGLLNPQDGIVAFKGVNMAALDRDALTKRISFVPQHALLFTGSIESNVRYGDPDVSDERVQQAIRAAQAQEFIDEAGGLDAQITQGGHNLSGGQRQRLSIARALAKDADLYLFDDSFSALDYRTEALVRAGIKDMLAAKTVVIVTQRISAALDADQVVMLSSEGSIEAIGTHDELFLANSTYRELAEAQLNQAEVNS